MSERDQYVEKIKARIDQWNADIDKMMAKAHEAEADARLDYEKQLAEMRAQRDEATKKVKELQNASGAAWDDMKAGFDAAWDTIASAFENASKRFK